MGQSLAASVPDDGEVNRGGLTVQYMDLHLYLPVFSNMTYSVFCCPEPEQMVNILVSLVWQEGGNLVI